MTTPTFKLLVNALRLGQPPEPIAAFKVLVEVIQQQENELADLRQRLNLLTSRLQFAEAKASRIEAASLQMSGQHGTVHPEPHLGSLPPAIPAMPPIPTDPRRGLPVGPAPTRQSRLHMDLRSSEEIQESMHGTLNVPRADIDAVVKHQVEKEAPYPLAPPGGYARPNETSGMPFKAARPLDPSGGSLSGPAPFPGPASRPPPPMAAPAGERPRSVPPPPPPARTPSVPTRSPSVPYIPIDIDDDDIDAPSDDMFSGEVVDPIEMPALAAAKNPVPIDIISEKGPPRLDSILDESSYDDSVLTSVLRRKPGGQGS